MKTHHVTIMPGDGIGPEVMNATIKVLKATGVPFYFDFSRSVQARRTDCPTRRLPR
jgi:isocitrate/isopropylmalate dehydrogenase